MRLPCRRHAGYPSSDYLYDGVPKQVRHDFFLIYYLVNVNLIPTPDSINPPFSQTKLPETIVETILD
jgi:hypothetical protein